MDVLLSGSVAFDYLMTFPGYFKDHLLPEHLEKVSLSFLVDTMVRQRGGVAPNIAYTLALLGGKPRLWATVGEDFEEYRAWLESRDVDTTGARVIPGVFTASFFVNTDLSNAQIASFYTGAMAYAAQLSLHDLAGPPPDVVVISPNDPEAMKRYVKECKELGLAYIYDPSQQIVRLTGDDLREGMSGALALFVNDYEAALIENMSGWSAEMVVERNPDAFVVVTRGEEGAQIYTRSEVCAVPMVPADEVVDPTGVGDAFRGGFLAGYSRGLGLETCGRMGALAATYCLEQKGTQAHEYSTTEFVARFREHFGDRGELDVLEQTDLVRSG